MEPVKRWLRAVLAWLSGRWLALRDMLRCTHGLTFIIIAVTAPGLVLIFMQQGQDLVVTIAEDDDYSRALWFAASAALLGYQAWLWSRWIILRNYTDTDGRWRWRRLVPRTLAVLPLLLAAVASLAPLVRSPNAQTPAATAGAAAAVLVLMAAWIILSRFIDKPVMRRVNAGAGSLLGPYSLTWPLALGIAVGGSLLGLGLMIRFPVALPQALGAPAVVFLALALMIPTMTVISQGGAELRLPLLPAVIGLAALSSCVNDAQHEVGRRAFAPVDRPRVQQTASLQQAYLQWLDQAPRAADGRVPIIFVISEGGASRAGYWTGEVLASLETATAGRFSRSVFAISSVSGGSVGAVGYVSTLHDGPAPTSPDFRTAVEEFAGADFLSPAVAGMLFPDLIQRFIPFPLLPDRAESLERAFERAWTVHCQHRPCGDPHRLERPFLSLWPSLSPGAPATAWRPLVLINGASQENGHRIITSPVDLRRAVNGEPAVDGDDFHDRTGHDVPVSTAVSNGARFPWISPAGLMRDRSGGWDQHIIDGGYFDPGGRETARELAHAVVQLNDVLKLRNEGLKRQDVQLQPVFLFIGYTSKQPRPKPPPQQTPRPPELPHGPPVQFANDSLAPIRGLFTSRSGHDRDIRVRLERDVQRLGWTSHQAWLCPGPDNVLVPMDWAMSDRAEAHSRDAVGLDPGSTDPCCNNSRLLPVVDAVAALRDPKATAAAATAVTPAVLRGRTRCPQSPAGGSGTQR